jgi:hypothetical protein
MARDLTDEPSRVVDDPQDGTYVTRKREVRYDARRGFQALLSHEAGL